MAGPGKVLDFRLGDILALKKQHPCGGTRWEVVRLGQDIGIVCQTCQHRVLMPRSQLERRVKRVLAAGNPGPASSLFAED